MGLSMLVNNNALYSAQMDNANHKMMDRPNVAVPAEHARKALSGPILIFVCCIASMACAQKVQESE